MEVLPRRETHVCDMWAEECDTATQAAVSSARHDLMNENSGVVTPRMRRGL